MSSASTPLVGSGTSNINNDIPRYVQFTSPVSTSPLNPNGTGAALPLNIVALIVSYLEEPADFASVVRTCRLLYYMTLPSLYAKVSLRSYPDIRYVGGRPEGFGSGSPFLMALNGLVAGTHAAMVKELRLWGDWGEPGLEDFAKGRVPDNTVMLNIITRAAVDRMNQLQTLVWQLDCKPLKTLYQGLAAHKTLTSLSLKFPSTRDPRPCVMIPPMANLRKFKATDIDPLCYPDDISMLLLGSKKLEDLRLHFSPRMRREAECTLSLDTFFGRCVRAGHSIPLKHFAMQNWFGPNIQGMDQIAALETLVSMCAFDMFGGPGSSHGGTRNVYLDASWEHVPQNIRTRFTTIRVNERSSQHATLLSNAEKGLENLYFVSKHCSQFSSTPEGSVPTPPGSSPPSQEETALGKQYIYMLTRHHGPSLKRLLLPDQWSLDQNDLSDLIRHCPNLEQLGLAISVKQHNILRILIPFLPKLTAVRLLANDSLNEHLRTVSNEVRMAGMSSDMWKTGVRQLKWIGVGDRIYKTGKTYSVPKEDGAQEWKREVLEATWDDVKDIEIWKMDCLDLDADPVLPFEP